MQDLAGADSDPIALAEHLYAAGLGALAQALSIPEPPLPRPRDPNGYYTGVVCCMALDLDAVTSPNCLCHS